MKKRRWAMMGVLMLCGGMLCGCVQDAPKEEPVQETQSSAATAQPADEVEEKELYAQRQDLRIYGVLYTPQGVEEKLPVIIYAHGLGGSYQYGIPYARAMASRGFAVYCFDFCGGSPGSRSDGEQTEMSVFSEQQDLEAVIGMLRAREEIDEENIFLLGSSQGGMVSAMTAADHEEEIAGAVLLYPAFVLVDDAKERFASVEDVPDTYEHLFMQVGRAYAEALLDDDVYADIAGYARDVLIIHGDADPIVPLSYSQKAVQVLPSAELKVIPGAGHGFSGEDEQQAITWMAEYFLSHVNEQKG